MAESAEPNSTAAEKVISSCTAGFDWFDYLPFHVKEKFHVYHSTARSDRSMSDSRLVGLLNILNPFARQKQKFEAKLTSGERDASFAPRDL